MMKVCKHCHCRKEHHPHPIAGKICARYEEMEVASPSKIWMSKTKAAAFRELLKKAKRGKNVLQAVR